MNFKNNIRDRSSKYNGIGAALLTSSIASNNSTEISEA